MDHRSKCKTMNPLEKHIGENLPDQRLGKHSSVALEAWSIKEKNDKLNIVNIKNFCFANDTVKRM